MRIGIGYDIHRLQPGNVLPLGGIPVPGRFSAVAVSDGDVVLHAVVDALLGAMGRGDIGSRYPKSAVVAGESSSRFVREVMVELGQPRLINLDCTIHLQEPNLSHWKPSIRVSLAALLGVVPGRVNIKAKTGEGVGPVGRSEAVAAEVALLLDMED